MQSLSSRLVVLATGGTIAGRADSAQDNVGYRSAQLGVADLLQAVPGAGALAVEGEQVAQLDSKDMDAATWQRLARRVAHHLARPEVRGLVITHGTDTLEETAWLLQRVLAPHKPVVLTAAMRPATSLQADGPQNLADALVVAAADGAAGVLAVLAGRVLAAGDVRKVHSWRLDAFDAGDAGPVAAIEQGRLRLWRPWPAGQALGLARVDGDPSAWPWVEIVTSHAGASGAAAWWWPAPATAPCTMRWRRRWNVPRPAGSPCAWSRAAPPGRWWPGLTTAGRCWPRCHRHRRASN